MDQKSEEKREVDPLPPDGDSFWKDAEVNRYEVGPNLACGKKEHKFIQKGSTAECTKCPVGYNLGAGGEVKDGHIFVKGQLLI